MSDKCKSCGAKIIWAFTEAGRRIPLDAKPEQRFVLDAPIQPHAALLQTYQTHFVTCPDAAAHRKTRSGE